MERFAAMGKAVSAFVNWEEVFSTNRKGRKEVRYYLKRRDGTSDLAVVGKEKTSGNSKTTSSSSSSSYRYRYAIRDESLFPSLNLPFELPSNPRSRREVIHWLSGIVTDGSVSVPRQPANGLLGAGDTLRLDLEKFEDTRLHKMSQHTTEFTWVGSVWNCRKKRKHYGAYTRRGVRISVQDFVYVLAEGGRRLVAYLNDLYEDSRGEKMALVRWFHKVDEAGLDLPHTYTNEREVFFSLCLQDISIKCIDGLATVLSPQHYYKFLKTDVLVNTNLDPFVCQNQIDNKVIKPFDITQVKGYWNQCIHRSISTLRIRPKKRLRKLVDGESNSDNRLLGKHFVHEYTVGSEIEVLSQDSGIRGLWFRAVVIKKHKDKLKVRYQDLMDATNESVNLEEWVLSSRVAVADELGIRHSGRMTIRPARSSNNNDVCAVEVGCIVDAWLHDGWWEGIVVRKEYDHRIHVYFPGEKQQSIFGCKDLRYSQEWLGDDWKEMKHRPDVAVSIYCATETNSQTAKSNDYLSSDLSSENKDIVVANHYHSKEDLLAHLKWSWSTKKRRMGNDNIIEGTAVRTRKRDGFLMPVSIKVEHESCKFVCAPVASPLPNLVMSR